MNTQDFPEIAVKITGKIVWMTKVFCLHSLSLAGGMQLSVFSSLLAHNLKHFNLHMFNYLSENISTIWNLKGFLWKTEQYLQIMFFETFTIFY